MLSETFQLLFLDLFLEIAPGVGEGCFSLDGKIPENVLEVFDFH
jgi:hypothetical protein